MKLTVRSQNVDRRCPDAESWPEGWKLRGRLTVKRKNSALFISANRDVFHALSYGSGLMRAIPDSYENSLAIHHHFDATSGIAAAGSPGLTLGFWSDKELMEQDATGQSGAAPVQGAKCRVPL